MTKPRSKSKTLWINIATAVGMLASFALAQAGTLPLSEDALAWVLFAVGVLNAGSNVVLRLHTHQPLRGTAGEEKALRIR